MRVGEAQRPQSVQGCPDLLLQRGLRRVDRQVQRRAVLNAAIGEGSNNQLLPVDAQALLVRRGARRELRKPLTVLEIFLNAPSKIRSSGRAQFFMNFFEFGKLSESFCVPFVLTSMGGAL